MGRKRSRGRAPKLTGSQEAHCTQPTARAENTPAAPHQDIQGLMVLCPIALRTDPEASVAAKGLGSPAPQAPTGLLPAPSLAAFPATTPATRLHSPAPQREASRFLHGHIPAHLHAAVEGTAVRAAVWVKVLMTFCQAQRGVGLEGGAASGPRQCHLTPQCLGCHSPSREPGVIP